MNKTNTKTSPRELANLRKGFKQQVLREWKNFDDEKFSFLLARKQLIFATRDEANKMLNEYLQVNKDYSAHEKALRIVQAKHVSNIFKEDSIDGLAILIRAY